MVQTGVVGHEVEKQPQAAHTEPLAETAERRVAAEVIVDDIARDREPRAADVLLAEIRQRLFEFASPLGIRTRDSLRSRSSLPYTEEPNPIETFGCDMIQ